MKHFKLRTDLTIEVGGKTLYRIEATKDIKRFCVKAGDLGGYIEKEDNLSGNAWVSGDAFVYGNAKVSGDALVCDNAFVSGNAFVCGNALVSGHAWVYGNAEVYGNAKVRGNAQVHGNTWVCGNAWVYGNAQVRGDASVDGDAQVRGDAQVYGNAEVSGDTIEKENDLINITSNACSYNITITPNHIKIGCQYHSKTEWFNFTENEIVKMDGEKAVEWWRTWKPILKQICDSFASNKEE